MDAPRKSNRLAGESSPYLRLHRHNPVDWYPWGEEALSRSRREDKPIFLSVGYSTCYWCHVMERESFSDEGIAELMNREFVNIKVDREERPELDEIYMTATQLLTGHGGWPNSVFLTPDLLPFFAGTYFPPHDRRGIPGFARVLHSLADAWRNRRDDIDEQAASVGEGLRRYLEERTTADRPPGPEVAARSYSGLAARFDERWGGFGDAPKFPTPSNLLLLEGLLPAEERAAEMLDATLDQMARGGIYDQLGGGFHRYATDREWRVPHFEKMLYDNGLLLELYARRWRRSGDPQSARVVRRTVDFLARELTSPEGALWSALDAETGGDEGAFYVWTRDELRAVLGDESFGFLAPIYGFDGPPFFEGERYVLHLPRPLAEQAAKRRMPLDELVGQVEPLRERLLAARAERPRPLTDRKVLADWNGMAIAGLAEAGRLLGEPPMLERAAAAAGALISELRPRGGGLMHVRRGAEGGVPAFLSDYVFLVRGLLALERAGGGSFDWLGLAAELTDEQIDRLGDPAGGFFVAAESDDVLFRSKEVFDGAVPAANAVAVLNLLELAERTGERRWLDTARSSLAAFAARVEAAPEGARTMALAALRFHAVAETAADGVSSEGAATGPVSRAAEEEPVRVSGEWSGAADEEGWRPFTLRLEIAAGWHVYGHGAAGLGGLDVVSEGLELRDLAYPPGRTNGPELDGRPVEVCEGTVEIRGRARSRDTGGEGGESATGSDAGGRRAVVRIAFQACDARSCLTPRSVDVELG